MENLKSPRGGFSFSTWRRNDSSEVSFDSSEEFFLSHVANFHLPRGEFSFATWRLENFHVEITFFAPLLIKLLYSLALFCTFTGEMNIAYAL